MIRNIFSGSRSAPKGSSVELETWHAISREAENRSCFSQAVYVEGGFLNLDAEKFRPLRKWLVESDRPGHHSRLAFSAPTWVHVGEGRWRLGFENFKPEATFSKASERALTDVVVVGKLPSRDDVQKR